MEKVTYPPDDFLLLLQQRPDLSTVNSYTRTNDHGKVIQHFVKTEDGWIEDTIEYLAAQQPARKPKDDEWDLSDYYTEDDYE